MIDSSLLLLGLLAAIVAVPILLKRHRAAAPDGIRVLGRTALHKSAVVAVLAVGDRRLLVGAGERGVQVLAELDGAAEENHLDGGLVTTTTSSLSLGRTDAAAQPSQDPGGSALSALSTGGTGSTLVGPRIGLVDRLRAMTVRTPVRGRPLHDPLRR